MVVKDKTWFAHIKKKQNKIVDLHILKCLSICCNQEQKNWRSGEFEP